MSGILYVVATPIGNLEDITYRAVRVLGEADLIACEDTRHSRKLLDRYDIATPVTPYHDHNATAARPKLIARLAQGASIALISDAGTPLISDPGYKLVCEAQATGSSITVLPGPSALRAALIVSGLAAIYPRPRLSAPTVSRRSTGRSGRTNDSNGWSSVGAAFREGVATSGPSYPRHATRGRPRDR